ncbi:MULTISPECIES: hypothetical protein [Legionella]|uniref:Holin n=1 Tax=Legionella drozanskii LLAP-1 TaxID=1212489 RepID=A0A0W0SLF6_9GAMM|nr:MULTISPECIES: hypothetical protein [Legionella]KTC84247.1 hypothetical protein Ldro_3053 [Legionella drozanskii LLAP-1]PJE07202.1 MAG: hypothetical protein CK430_14375 [Legionella sp.]
MDTIISKIKVRSAIVVRHVMQSTTACLLAMTKGNLSVLTLYHWKIAIGTGLGTGLISLLASYGDLIKFQASRYGAATIAFIGTTIADYISHGATASGKESLVTGIGAALLCLFVSLTPLDKYLSALTEKKK